MARAKTNDVAYVSEPANIRSQIKMARWAPIASASRNTSSATGGPIVSTVTDAPCVSPSWSAASTACLQAGFIMPAARSLLSVPVFSSQGNSVTIGTCLMQTTIFNIASHKMDWDRMSRAITIRWISLVPS